MRSNCNFVDCNVERKRITCLFLSSFSLCGLQVSIQMRWQYTVGLVPCCTLLVVLPLCGLESVCTVCTSFKQDHPELSLTHVPFLLYIVVDKITIKHHLTKVGSSEFFSFHTYSREIIDMFPDMTKNYNVGFSADTVEVRFLKLRMIITLLGVYQFIPGFMTLILFQGHR